MLTSKLVVPLAAYDAAEVDAKMLEIVIRERTEENRMIASLKS